MPNDQTSTGVLPTLNQDGSRRWLRPKPSKGRFLFRRRATAVLLIAVFTLIPYLRMAGKPLILLDLAGRRFTLFGYTFLPTDTVLLALLLVGVFVAIFLLTAIFGRVWCGWACPQTVYLEFVFRPIERLFGGTPGRRPGPLAGKPYSLPLKLALYMLISAYLAHTFLAYFVGVDALRHWVTQSPLRHPGPFAVMAVVTGLMMFDFAYFREQTCIIACPYGRLQSVLLDRNSLVVSYDRARGEPRGKPRRGTDVALKVIDAGADQPRTSDCVDCRMCVTTCPTGIDIRNGLQMECIGCAQCIDACDAVMAKLGRPAGLIRYSSQAAMAGERRKLLRPRIIAYPLVLVAVITAGIVVLCGRGSADVTVLRGMGRPFVELPEDRIGNSVKIKIVNRGDDPQEFTVRVGGSESAGLVMEGNPFLLGPGQSVAAPAMISVPRSSFREGRTLVRVGVTGTNHFEKQVSYRLMGPVTTHPTAGSFAGEEK